MISRNYVFVLNPEPTHLHCTRTFAPPKLISHRLFMRSKLFEIQVSISRQQHVGQTTFFFTGFPSQNKLMCRICLKVWAIKGVPYAKPESTQIRGFSELSVYKAFAQICQIQTVDNWLLIESANTLFFQKNDAAVDTTSS